MKHKMSIVLRMVPLAATMGTIFLLSHQPGNRLSLPPFPGIDKIGHMMLYGTLAGTVIFAFSPRQRDTRPQRVLFLTMVFSLLYGISDEFHQSFIPGRSASVLDVLADCGGAAIASLFWAKWRRRISIIRC
jgi:VanZ family protein